VPKHTHVANSVAQRAVDKCWLVPAAHHCAHLTLFNLTLFMSLGVPLCCMQ
jgi:hypothetical protein